MREVRNLIGAGLPSTTLSAEDLVRPGFMGSPPLKGKAWPILHDYAY